MLCRARYRLAHLILNLTAYRASGVMAPMFSRRVSTRGSWGIAIRLKGEETGVRNVRGAAVLRVKEVDFLKVILTHKMRDWVV